MIGAFMLFCGFRPEFIGWAAHPLLAFLSLLCVVTTVNRIHQALREVR